jgi:twitching motility protein PilT
MAAIDSLLALVDAQQASGIVLRAREAPVLVGGKGRGLTIPPLDRETLELFAEEVLGPDERDRLRASGAYDSVYRSEKHGVFTLEARSSGGNLSLKLRRRGAAAPAKPAPAASVVTAPPASPPGEGLAELIVRAAGESASDVILSAGKAVWVRSASGLGPASSDVFEDADIRAFLQPLLDPQRLRTLQTVGSVDFPWEAPTADGGGTRRFRVNVFTQAHGWAAALRPLNRSAPSLAELNLPESLGSLANAPAGGMVLVVGPAGAGKSTTLAALVETINRTRARHVITLEDPIEFVYQPQRCLIHQREVGTHVETFAAGLRAALRECPDVLLIGEMRDRETAALALTAAETGHLVLSTLHSGSAPMAIDRIVDIFPEHQQAQVRHQLAGSLRAVLTQQLLQGASPGTRYPALELLTVSYAVGALIREGKTHQLATQIQTGRDEGMIAFEASLVELLRAGRISREVALAAARSPTELQRRLSETASAPRGLRQP